MSQNSDLIVDRRRLRRQLTFWRILFILAAIAGVLGLGFVAAGGGARFGQPHIARITIEGLITGRQETLDLFRRADNAAVKAVIVRINSGGGTTSGSEALYGEVRRLAAKKPVIAVIDGVGASGAYMTALGANRIMANGSAIVGSIGVIAQIPNVARLLDTLGVKIESVRSSPLKAMPNGIEPTPPEARAALEATVLETYRWFQGLVGERRDLSGEALDKVTDGRVFTGRQAVDLRLIDALGGEREAVAWLESEKGIAKDLSIRNYLPPQNLSTFPGLTALKGWLGGDSGTLFKEAAREVFGASGLDGLVSVWHPSGQ